MTRSCLSHGSVHERTETMSIPASVQTIATSDTPPQPPRAAIGAISSRDTPVLPERARVLPCVEMRPVFLHPTPNEFSTPRAKVSTTKAGRKERPISGHEIRPRRNRPYIYMRTLIWVHSHRFKCHARTEKRSSNQGPFFPPKLVSHAYKVAEDFLHCRMVAPWPHRA